MKSFIHSIYVIFAEKVKRFFLPMNILRANAIGLWAGIRAGGREAIRLLKNRQ